MGSAVVSAVVIDSWLFSRCCLVVVALSLLLCLLLLLSSFFLSSPGAPTHKTKWTVEDLVPGQSYQFTVHAMNLDGETGPASRPCVVSTMMQQPVGLRVVGE